MRQHITGFMDFIREQGVAGLAIGFMLGGAVSKVVTAIVTDLINPLVGLGLGAVGNLKDAHFQVASAKIAYGDLISTVIDFIIISVVVYAGVKIIGVDKLDKKKEETK